MLIFMLVFISALVRVTHKIPFGVGGGWLQNRVCFAIRRLHDLIKLRTQSFMDIKCGNMKVKARKNEGY